MNTRNMTIVGVLVGVLIVVVVGIGQLGGKVTGTLKDPAMAYPAALLDGTAIGKPDAPVTMEVYGDFQCSVCARFARDVEPALVSQYVAAGTLRIEHHELGIMGRGGPDDESVLAAKGAYCANTQGRYSEYAHWVYANQDGVNAGGFSRQRLTAIAEAAGVEPASFGTCLDDPAAAAAVEASNAKAVALGINSTPTLYIGDQQIVGLQPAAELGVLIEAELARLSASPAPSASATP